MGNEVSKNYGAKSQSALPMFDPEDISIVTDKNSPLYDERIDLPVDEDLVLSIMTHGVINPIIVRKNGESNGKPIIEVVAGRQRLRSCLEANKRLAKEGRPVRRIPATIYKDLDPKKLMAMIIIDNELRRNDDFVTKGKKAKRLMDIGVSIEDVAANFGVVPQSITNYISLLKCSDEILTALNTGEVSNDIARKLSKLTHEEQNQQLKEMRSSGALKGRKASKKLEQATGTPSAVLGMSKKQVKTLLESLTTMNSSFPTKEKYEFGMLLVKSILEDCPVPFCPFMEGISKEELENESLRRFNIAKSKSNLSASLIVPESEDDEDEFFPDDKPTAVIINNAIHINPKVKSKPKNQSDELIDLDSDDTDTDTSQLSSIVEAEENAKIKPRGPGRPRKVV